MDYCFAADRTLGKLAKWLRILGFDTIFESDASNQQFYEQLDPERVLLTRTAKIRNRFAAKRLVFIEADDVYEQLQQVIDELAITRKDIRVFSMCLQCNSPTIDVNKQSLYGLVPDYIWQTHDEFHRCRRCERIFWAGSHVERSREKIERLFSSK
jgi:uncharacterized protein with PIN domain